MIPVNLARYPAQPVTLKNGSIAFIRPLAVTDGEALAAFYAGIPTKTKRYYYPHPLDREHALRNIARVYSPLEITLVLKIHRGGIVGYAWSRWEQEEERRSTLGICLLPKYQNVGGGRALLTRLIEIAREIGPPVLSLTVQVANTRALTLYRKLGFTVIREQLVKHPTPAPGTPAQEYYYYMELPLRE